MSRKQQKFTFDNTYSYIKHKVLSFDSNIRLKHEQQIWANILSNKTLETSNSYTDNQTKTDTKTHFMRLEMMTYLLSKLPQSESCLEMGWTDRNGSLHNLFEEVGDVSRHLFLTTYERSRNFYSDIFYGDIGTLLPELQNNLPLHLLAQNTFDCLQPDAREAVYNYLYETGKSFIAVHTKNIFPDVGGRIAAHHFFELNSERHALVFLCPRIGRIEIYPIDPNQDLDSYKPKNWDSIDIDDWKTNRNCLIASTKEELQKLIAYGNQIATVIDGIPNGLYYGDSYDIKQFLGYPHLDKDIIPWSPYGLFYSFIDKEAEKKGLSVTREELYVIGQEKNSDLGVSENGLMYTEKIGFTFSTYSEILSKMLFDTSKNREPFNSLDIIKRLQKYLWKPHQEQNVIPTVLGKCLPTGSFPNNKDICAFQCVTIKRKPL